MDSLNTQSKSECIVPSRIVLIFSVNIYFYLLILFAQVISEANRAKSQVCLKDLCAEDKRRIASLIEELAR